MKKLLMAGAAALMAGSAMAADLPTTKAPFPAPVVIEYDWTGFYFGGNVGGLWGSRNFSEYNTVNGLFVTNGSNNFSSFKGGGQIGYRYMFPQRFVIGAEASLDWDSGTDHTRGLGGNVVGVAGYAWGDFLPFIKGGWAWSSSTATFVDNFGTIGTLTAPAAEQASLSRSGWTTGGGLAYHVWQNWEVFAQYMYANYGSTNINFIAAQRSVHSSLTTNAVTGGVNLKF
jgi:outer membrane immunogenic protein